MPTATQPAARADLELAGGTIVEIRPIQPADAPELVELYRRCSAQSRYLRFHSWKPRLRGCEAEYLAAADGERRLALVATAEGYLVADAHVEPLEDGDAEAAVIVRDDFHGRGLGRALVAALVDRAAAGGYRRLLLHVLPENEAMVRLASRFGAAVVGTDGPAVVFAVALSTVANVVA